MLSTLNQDGSPGGIDCCGRTIRVLLADDHRLMREGIASLLSDEPDIVLVGEASNGLEAIELAERHDPDVIIMDITMPVMSGVEATLHITRKMPRIRVIALSVHHREDMANVMKAAGAAAYLTKDGPMEDLVLAIRRETSDL